MKKNNIYVQKGQGLVEYSLILVLISLVAVSTLATMGVNVTAWVTYIATTLGTSS